MVERDDLTAEEARALAALASGPPPPAKLEDETVERLAAEGLLRRPRRRLRAALIAAAAAIAFFAAGLFVGERRSAGDERDTPSRQYVLLLYDAPGERSLTDAEVQQRIAEYRAWAEDVRRRGARIHGEKLERDGRWLGAVAGDGGHPLGGFFVLSAPDDAAAEAVARGCPHLKHGGTVEIRPIAKT